MTQYVSTIILVWILNVIDFTRQYYSENTKRKICKIKFHIKIIVL